MARSLSPALASHVATVVTYRVKQVAEMLNVPVSTVYDWVRTGVIASVRVGAGRRKLTLIPASAVEEFLSRNLRSAKGGKP